MMAKEFNFLSPRAECKQFLIKDSFEMERSVSQFVTGIVRYNLRAIGII